MLVHERLAEHVWTGDSKLERVLGAGAGALVVAGQNFDADVITYLMVVAIIGFVVLFPSAGELGKRVKGVEEEGSIE